MTSMRVRLVLGCAIAMTMNPIAWVNALPDNDFYGSVQAADVETSSAAAVAVADSAQTPAMEFNTQQQSDGSFNFTTAAPTTSDDGSSTPSLTASPPTLLPTVPPTPSPAPTPSSTPRDGSCQWQGYSLRHRSAKYFVGRAHRRGSIFGECHNGTLKCYEDSGIADVQSSEFREIKCEPLTIFARQRDLDLEDQVADEALSSTASISP